MQAQAGQTGTDADEAAIHACVRRFYELGGADSLLGPIFNAAITDLEHHMEIVADFWSHALLGGTRYQGTPFAAHVQLPIEPAHFGRWLELFTSAAKETMPETLSTAAIARAAHMTECFQSGLFPFKDKDGQPSRTPA